MSPFKRIIPGTIDSDFPCIYNPEFDETVCQLYPIKYTNPNLMNPHDMFWEFINFMFFYLPISFVLSSMLYVYVNKNYITTYEEQYKQPEAVEYKDKYPITKEQMENVKDIDKEKSKERKEYCSIIEYVPDIGNVIMCYNQEKSGFNYWADRTVPHKKLLTVCRKYVTSFNCIELYQDEGPELPEEPAEEKKTEEPAEEEKTEEPAEEEKTEEPVKEENSVFASFKNYKTQGNPNAKRDEIKNKKENKKEDRKGLVSKKINNFVYKGKINNFSMNSMSNDDNEESKDIGNWGVSISFADFKKMASNN